MHHQLKVILFSKALYRPALSTASLVDQLSMLVHPNLNAISESRYCCAAGAYNPQSAIFPKIVTGRN